MANGTQQVSDNFTRANENPLSNGGTWTTITGLSALKILSNICQPTATSSSCGALWTGQAWANDQYVEVTLNATLGTSDFVVPILRSDANRANNYEASISGVVGNQVQIAKNVATVNTVLKSINLGGAPQAGDVFRFTAFGAALIIYRNGKYIGAAEDVAISSGTVGVRNFSTTTLATSGMTSFTAGIPSGNVNGPWTKQGLVMKPNSTDLNSGALFSGISNQTMLYEGNAQILSGNVFKMWFMGGNSIFYAESITGLPGSWSRRSSAVMTGVGLPRIFKNGSTYNMYVSHAPTVWTQIDRYTSTDGITWALANANVFNVGVPGEWDENHVLYFTPVAIIGGVWNAIYAGDGSVVPFGIGLATSPDGIVWTRYAGNPIYVNRGIMDGVHLVNGLYYAWLSRVNIGQLNSFNGPGGTIRLSTPDFKTWSSDVFSLELDTAFEGVNSLNGEASVPSILEVGGTTFQFYNTSPNDSDATIAFQLAVATAPYTIAQLVAQQEYFQTSIQGASDNFTRADGGLGANWTTPSGATAIQIASNKAECSATGGNGCKAAYTGTSFSNDQYSEITIAAFTTSNLASMTPTVRMSLVADTYYQLQLSSPAGTAFAAFQLFKHIAGVSTAIGPVTTITAQVGDVIRLSVVGNILSAFQNGALVLQYPDATSAIASGAPGMVMFATTAITNAQVSLWAGGAANGTAPPYPPATFGVPSTLNLTMLDGTTVSLAIPNGYTANQYVSALRKAGGVWDAPSDPSTPANWWPYKDWRKAVTS